MVQDVDKALKGVERSGRRSFLPGGVKMSRGVKRVPDCGLRNAQSATEFIDVLRSERLGVRETVFAVQPDPKRGLRDLNSPRKVADRKSESVPRRIDQFLKRRVRGSVMN